MKAFRDFEKRFMHGSTLVATARHPLTAWRVSNCVSLSVPMKWIDGDVHYSSSKESDEITMRVSNLIFNTIATRMLAITAAGWSLVTLCVGFLDSLQRGVNVLEHYAEIAGSCFGFFAGILMLFMSGADGLRLLSFVKFEELASGFKAWWRERRRLKRERQREKQLVKNEVHLVERVRRGLNFHEVIVVSERVADEWIQEVASKNPQTRLDAVAWLGTIGRNAPPAMQERIVRGLIPAIEGTDDWIRYRAICALEKFNGAAMLDVVPVLIRVVESVPKDERLARLFATRELVKIWKTAHPELKEKLASILLKLSEDEGYDVRHYASKAFEK